MKLSHFVACTCVSDIHKLLARSLHEIVFQERVAHSLTLEGEPLMLMRNSEYQIEKAQECRHPIGETPAVLTSREMMLGPLVVILLLVIAILLRALS